MAYVLFYTLALGEESYAIAWASRRRAARLRLAASRFWVLMCAVLRIKSMACERWPAYVARLGFVYSFSRFSFFIVWRSDTSPTQLLWRAVGGQLALGSLLAGWGFDVCSLALRKSVM